MNGDFAIHSDGAAWLPGNLRLMVGNSSWDEFRVSVRQVLHRAGYDVAQLAIENGPRRSQLVAFSGAVDHPGSIGYRRGLRLSDVIVVAQPSVGADLQRIEIEGVDGSIQYVDAPDGGRTNGEWNVPIRPGDRLFFAIAAKSSQVSVLGEVAQPGKVDFYAGLTALRAIGLAGGMSGNAQADRIEVVRDGKVVAVANAVLNQDVPLQRGDTVRAPIVAKPKFVFVTGAVKAAGRFAYRTGMRLTEALNLAGGLEIFAAKNEIYVVRRENGNQKKVRHDLGAILSRKSANPILLPGDIVDVAPIRISRSNAKR